MSLSFVTASASGSRSSAPHVKHNQRYSIPSDGPDMVSDEPVELPVCKEGESQQQQVARRTTSARRTIDSERCLTTDDRTSTAASSVQQGMRQLSNATVCAPLFQAPEQRRRRDSAADVVVRPPPGGTPRDTQRRSMLAAMLESQYSANGPSVSRSTPVLPSSSFMQRDSMSSYATPEEPQHNDVVVHGDMIVNSEWPPQSSAVELRQALVRPVSRGRPVASGQKKPSVGSSTLHLRRQQLLPFTASSSQHTEASDSSSLNENQTRAGAISYNNQQKAPRFVVGQEAFSLVSSSYRTHHPPPQHSTSHQALPATVEGGAATAGLSVAPLEHTESSAPGSRLAPDTNSKNPLDTSLTFLANSDGAAGHTGGPAHTTTTTSPPSVRPQVRQKEPQYNLDLFPSGLPLTAVNSTPVDSGAPVLESSGSGSKRPKRPKKDAAKHSGGGGSRVVACSPTEFLEDEELSGGMSLLTQQHSARRHSTSRRTSQPQTAGTSSSGVVPVLTTVSSGSRLDSPFTGGGNSSTASSNEPAVLPVGDPECAVMQQRLALPASLSPSLLVQGKCEPFIAPRHEVGFATSQTEPSESSSGSSFRRLQRAVAQASLESPLVPVVSPVLTNSPLTQSGSDRYAGSGPPSARRRAPQQTVASADEFADPFPLRKTKKKIPIIVEEEWEGAWALPSPQQPAPSVVIPVLSPKGNSSSPGAKINSWNQHALDRRSTMGAPISVPSSARSRQSAFELPPGESAESARVARHSFIPQPTSLSAAATQRAMVIRSTTSAPFLRTLVGKDGDDTSIGSPMVVSPQTQSTTSSSRPPTRAGDSGIVDPLVSSVSLTQLYKPPSPVVPSPPSGSAFRRRTSFPT